MANLYPMRETVFWHLSYLSNFYLFINQDWNGNVSHFWSLAVEEQFYLFWPFIVLFTSTDRLQYLFLTATIIGLFSIMLLPVFSPATHLLSVLPNHNFFALGLGALLSLKNTNSRMIQILLSFSAYSIAIVVISICMTEFGIQIPWIEQIKECSIVLSFFLASGPGNLRVQGTVRQDPYFSGSCLFGPNQLRDLYPP